MGMNRRNALIGMGTIAAGGGALFATGAFSQVEASRTVSVQTAGDSGAFLGLNDLGVSGAISETDGVVEIDLAQAGSGNGINYDAKTSIGEVDDTGSPSDVTTGALEIANNGTNTVDIDIVVSYSSSQTDTTNLPSAENVLQFIGDTADGTGTSGTINSETVGNVSQYTLTGLSPGDSIHVMVLLDTTGITESDVSDPGSNLFDDVTFVANSQ